VYAAFIPATVWEARRLNTTADKEIHNELRSHRANVKAFDTIPDPPSVGVDSRKGDTGVIK
jgi:hypothetical protein